MAFEALGEFTVPLNIKPATSLKFAANKSIHN